jgi:hypothetical protein
VSGFASTVRVVLSGTTLIAAALVVGGATAQTGKAPPDFSSNETAWQGGNGVNYTPVPGSPPPITNDPKHPHISNGEATRRGVQPTYRISDLTNPNLKPWAKAVMKKDNDEVLAGKIGYTPGSSCKPWGVPAYMLDGGPYYFVQTPQKVTIIHQGDTDVRHIYLNVPHSANLKPSWYGESVGHYEGDTLVVDTIGLNNKSFVDHFRTPHTEKLHVIERWRTIDDGKQLEVLITIEDQDTFNLPWQVTLRWRRVQEPLPEVICSENNLNLFDYGMPVATRPDF